MGETKRITLANGVITNQGPTGRGAEGDTIDFPANLARQLIGVGNAEETTDPVETKAEKAERKVREKTIADDEAKLAADKAAHQEHQ